MNEFLEKLKNAGIVLLVFYLLYRYIIMHFDKKEWWKYWLITISLIFLTVASKEIEKRKFNESFQEVNF